MSRVDISYNVRCEWNPQGYFLLWGELDHGHSIDGMSFKHELFTWHIPSLYGTMLELERIHGHEGVRLSAWMAMDFLAAPRVLVHRNWIWSEELIQLREAATLLAECIGRRWYKPSFEAWLQGRLAWTWDVNGEFNGAVANDKLEQDTDPISRAELEAIKNKFVALNVGTTLMNKDALQAWFTHALQEQLMLASEGLNAWQDVLAEYPLLFQPPTEQWVDEEDWLIASGWKVDPSPFRSCLQLIEPADPSEPWQLGMVLQDKSDAAALYSFCVDVASGLIQGNWPSTWDDDLQLRVEKDMARWNSLIPELISTSSGLLTELDANQAWAFMSDYSLRLAEAGYTVLLPAWWEALRKNKPRLKAKIRSTVGSSGSSLFGLKQLVDFDWRLAIGEVDLSEAEFAALMLQNQRLIHYKGQWIQLDPAMLAEIQKMMNKMGKRKGLSFQEVLELHLLGNRERQEGSQDFEEEAEHNLELPIEVELNEHLLSLIGQLQQYTQIPTCPVPTGLRAELRKYQQEGFSWLLFLRQFGLGGCLADDMGLGKTVQFIAYLQYLKEQQEVRHAEEVTSQSITLPPSLLVCPTSVLGNWQKELSRFAPNLKVHLHYGAKRAKGDDFIPSVQDFDLVLTSYTLASMDQEELGSMEWSTLCLDEAQNIKNVYTKQSSALRGFEAIHRIALTGTPIENRLTELWSIYDFINPGYLGSLREFSTRFVGAVEKHKDADRLADLQKLVKPFLLRRKKKDPSIQLDLPDKFEMKTYVSLTAEQGALYENIVQELLRKMNEATGIERKGIILAALTQLKQLCNHPSLYLKEPQPEDVLARSSKLERLLAMVRELREEGDRCLIFTQYVEMGKMLKTLMEQELDEPILFLHGGVSKAGRDRMINEFQQPRELIEQTVSIDSTWNETEPHAAMTVATQPNVFILSLKAGGTGLNLTAANHVFHFDRWWNPAVENQATDRAFRIGQTRDVQVHKFITLGTLEERIDEMIESKQQLSSDVISTSEGWITELSTNELQELFSLRREWVG